MFTKFVCKATLWSPQKHRSSQAAGLAPYKLPCSQFFWITNVITKNIERRCSSLNSCFIFGTSQVQTSVRGLAILTGSFTDVHPGQYLKFGHYRVLQCLSKSFDVIYLSNEYWMERKQWRPRLRHRYQLDESEEKKDLRQVDRSCV